MKEWLRYAAAVLGFIGLSLLTKKYLTWTYGPIYFMVVLEALPRVLRWCRGLFRRAQSRLLAPSTVPDP